MPRLPAVLRKTQVPAMNQLDHQLDRLLRCASTAEVAAQASAAIPEVRDLLRQREIEVTAAAAGLHRTLRGGLAFACGLLMLALLANGLWIHQTRNDVLTVPRVLLTRHATP